MPEPQFSFSPTPQAAPRRRTGTWLAMALLAIVAAAGGWLYHDPSLVAPYLQGTPFELPATQTRAYKWRDAEGRMQLTDTPPPAGVPHEVITVGSRDNVMPLVPRD